MAKVQIKYEKPTPFGGIFGFRLWSNLMLFSSKACIEHLLRQQCLCQPVQDRLWLKTMLFWLNQRITSRTRPSRHIRAIGKL